MTFQNISDGNNSFCALYDNNIYIVSNTILKFIHTSFSSTEVIINLILLKDKLHRYNLVYLLRLIIIHTVYIQSVYIITHSNYIVVILILCLACTKVYSYIGVDHSSTYIQPPSTV